ncbi:Protein of unknown function [Bacillus mycoides]|nr:Protein of unknown function [Bacillus mycoides]
MRTLNTSFQLHHHT